MDIVVDVQNASQASDLPDQEILTGWVTAALLHHESQEAQEQPGQVRSSTEPGARNTVLKRNLELTIRIVDEVEAQQLNETWRQRTGPTNVLSFPYESPECIENLGLLGDIVICAPLVEREAAEQRKSRYAHWAHLVIHGTLHLLGYDHTDDSQAQVMEKLEISILHNLGYPNPYQD